MAIHVAVTCQVRHGRETEFQAALREFLQTSFNHQSVLGASMLTPLPGSDQREYGVLRTFASEAEHDAFYASPLFRAWEERARTMTEGEMVRRRLDGLEAWFRSPQGPPPRWKMAVATFLGVYPTSLLLNLTVGPWTRGQPLLLGMVAFDVAMVTLLTWAVMPLVTRLLDSWLQPPKRRSASS